jgi:hypothetical protein
MLVAAKLTTVEHGGDRSLVLDTQVTFRSIVVGSPPQARLTLAAATLRLESPGEDGIS